MLLLAPMEGLLDFVLRDILTRVGGVDRCVSEFIRITSRQLPPHVFYRIVPELHHGGRTLAGVPVRPQLLGSDPACLGDNAAVLVSLGASGIDLNFGCPAKVVNRHGGGAALLDDPELIARIVSQVRRTVPAHVAVSAKMRLGFDDDLRAEECAQAICQSGATELVVHARTKADGYRPPAYWERIADVRAVVKLPVIANGEIWTAQDALRCRDVSGCEHLMLGRGMVANPGLALSVRQALAGVHEAGQPDGVAESDVQLSWPTLLPLMREFWLIVCARLERRQQAGRLKQWLNYLRRHYPEAEIAYQHLRTVNDVAFIGQWIETQIAATCELALASD
jgi:tRNA-dihydrouridine synthase C